MNGRMDSLFIHLSLTLLVSPNQNKIHSMYDGFPGFPGQLHDMIVAADASGLEALLERSVDIASGWCGTVRTEPDSRVDVSGGHHDNLNINNASVGALKAATTALLAGYYVVRFGPDCDSPYDFTPHSPGPGDEWPGGCFGDWVVAPLVASTLLALPEVPALHPGTPRQALPVTSNVTSFFRSPSSSSAYAALRFPRSGNVGSNNNDNSSGSDNSSVKVPSKHDGGEKGMKTSDQAAVVVLNMAREAASITIDLSGSSVTAPQSPTDLIDGGQGPVIHQGALSSWSVELPAYGWAAFGVVIKNEL